MFESLLNNSFTVTRRKRTSDNQGGWKIGYASVGTVAGRIRPATSAEQEIAMQEGRHLTHVLYTLATADIERGDRVTCGDLTVDVLGIREPSLAGHHYEIDCEEWQKEVDA
jgi:SPP1 family predicted phage head-tail adaptor